ncbi:PP2C family protein-serine/threonine phosphatase [Euhalothece natronophila Z-M001]|uniref:PP2C family protein-serine/threonine phosphatase n=1 Tax=Euhalothece natronophila Z-M001 TaxID=522448 RepID=A0A5B8NJF8_9CHRO|nr:PP2C family protein-serine/threonine phosphatase [Euhalothece natronophila]QDZ39443.1 PP2C family protein-serine/threonine phosphatase [Euhalothece natronophila Z-M001]
MTALPAPQPYSEDHNFGENFSTKEAPVTTLKELVASLSREQNKVQNLLSSLGFALRSFNNLNQFLEIIPLMAARVSDTDGSALLLYKGEGKITLEQLHCQGGVECQEVRHSISKVTRKLAKENSENLGENLDLDSLIEQALPHEIKVFGTPILTKGRERGRLYVFTRDRAYEWTLSRQKLVQLVADQVAVAIANNDLTLEVQQKEKLDRELEVATDIQFHLLPRKYPKIKGLDLAAACRTANRVGGDYYDFIPANYDQPQTDTDAEGGSTVPWSIVIGDVMGKGVPAGLIMTMTRGMLRAEVLNHHSPAKILEHLNRVMYEDLESSHRFVTLFYSQYDPQTRRLSYSNAAHNPPLWWEASTNLVHRLDTAGMLVGLDTNSEYEDNTVQLSPGDTVLYYTDGFTDAVNPKGQRFEEENLIQAFHQAAAQHYSSEAIVQHLFETVQAFIGNKKKLVDDMTLVAMQVQETN